MERQNRTLLNILRDEQEEHGYLSEHVLKQVSLEQDVPLAKLYGVARFYTMLRTEPAGENIIEICMSTSCFLNGSKTLKECLEAKLALDTGATSHAGMISLSRVPCIGCCNEAPAMLVNGEPYTKLTEERIEDILEELRD